MSKMEPLFSRRTIIQLGKVEGSLTDRCELAKRFETYFLTLLLIYGAPKDLVIKHDVNTFRRMPIFDRDAEIEWEIAYKKVFRGEGPYPARDTQYTKTQMRTLYRYWWEEQQRGQLKAAG